MLAVVACFTLVSIARAELTASGDLFVTFSGGIKPRALPRHARVPISLEVAGTVRTLSGERPPALRQIKIAINSGGHLDTRGLPTCSRLDIEPTSSDEAMAICGAALVGSGNYRAEIAYPEQTSFISRGHILAFNSVVGGQRAVLAQIYGTRPVPISLLVVFHIRQRGGAFGTVLSGALPESVIRYGYLNSISLDLHREFSYGGRRHSYLSAACTAPAGFPGAVFPFARATMGFADGRTLSSTITRSCKVRDE